MEIKYFDIYKQDERIIITNNIKKESLHIHFKSLQMYFYNSQCPLLLKPLTVVSDVFLQLVPK